MSASDLPLGVCQRIEQRWSAQLKRLQQERDLKAKAETPHHSNEPDSCAPVDIAEWSRQRER